MSNLFRYVAAASTGVSTSQTDKPAAVQSTTTRRATSACNYDNNYYGDQVCSSCKP